MNYTPEQREVDCKALDVLDSAIREDRGKRYGTKEDTLANVAAFGWRGAVISLYECAMRLRNAFYATEPNVDDIKNACQDARNYARYIEILLKRETDDSAKS
jgi:hypothetical protein